MRLLNSAHTSRPWRIHEVTPDFQVEDVWALDTPGGPGDLSRLVSQFVDHGFPSDAPIVVRALWEARERVGGVLGWDGERTGVGSRVPSLRDRLPDDLLDAPTGLQMPPFSPVFQLEDEWAAELANQTVHAVLHIGWVADESGGFHGQLAVLVKPNGPLGKVYMAAIKPFRYALVYPALLRGIERQWRESADDSPPPKP